MESPSVDGSTPTFTLQGRLGMVSFWQVTTHLALAFGHSNLAFHVRILSKAVRLIFIFDGSSFISLGCLLALECGKPSQGLQQLRLQMNSLRDKSGLMQPENLACREIANS